MPEDPPIIAPLTPEDQAMTLASAVAADRSLMDPKPPPPDPEPEDDDEEDDEEDDEA